MLMWISEIKIFTDLNVNIRQYIVLDINGYECLYLWISILDIHRYAHVNIWGHYIDRYDVHICEYLWIYLTNTCEYNGPMSVQIPGPDINRGFYWREYLFLKFSDIHNFTWAYLWISSKKYEQILTCRTADGMLTMPDIQLNAQGKIMMLCG